EPLVGGEGEEPERHGKPVARRHEEDGEDHRVSQGCAEGDARVAVAAASPQGCEREGREEPKGEEETGLPGERVQDGRLRAEVVDVLVAADLSTVPGVVELLARACGGGAGSLGDV